MTMAVPKDVRRSSLDFFINLLKEQGSSMKCDKLRLQALNAPKLVKKYLYENYGEEKFLDFFKKRVNYFTVESDTIYLKNSLKRSSITLTKGTSFDSILSKCDPSDGDFKNLEESIEDTAIEYFSEKLNRNGDMKIDALNLQDIPKKVRRFITESHEGNLRGFFLRYPTHFFIKAGSVSTKTTTETCLANTPTENNGGIEQDEVEVDVSEGLAYIESIRFFVDEINQCPTGYPIDRLSGVYAKAPENIRSFIRENYRKFTDFFLDAPYIFSVNSTSKEVSLRLGYRDVLLALQELVSDFRSEYFTDVGFLLGVMLNPLPHVAYFMKMFSLINKEGHDFDKAFVVKKEKSKVRRSKSQP